MASTLAFKQAMSEPSCFHCDLPVEDVSRWTLLVDDKERVFCCPACKAVAETIIAGGFNNYYRYRTEIPEKAEAYSPSFQIYDDEVVQQSFVKKKGEGVGEGVGEGIVEAQLFVSDIHCAACCWLIESSLNNFEAVKKVQVSLATHRVFVEWDRTDLALSKIFERIASLGYKVCPFQEDNYQHLLVEENRRYLKRLGVAGLAMMQVGMLSVALYAGDFQGIDEPHVLFLRWFGLLLCIPVVLYSSVPFFKGALRPFLTLKNPFNNLGMDVPISLAIASAFIASVYGVLYSAEVYFDSVCMFVFFLLLARYIESRSRQKYLSRSYRSLLPASTRRVKDKHSLHSSEAVPISLVKPGDSILVLSGEAICFDAKVVSGRTEVNEMAYTGEQRPRSVDVGDDVFAGTVIGDGPIVISVLKPVNESRLAAVEELVSKAILEKPQTVLMINKLATKFTLLVLTLAISTWVFWSYFAVNDTFGVNAFGNNTFEIVLAVLVVSCPCALSLATPAALAFSHFALREKGVVLTGAHVQEGLNTITHLLMDKTGTLTEGNLSIASQEIFGQGNADEIIEVAAALELCSKHPLARAFRSIATHKQLTHVKIVSGRGVEGFVDGQHYRIGSEQFCTQLCQQSLPHIQENSSVDNGVITQTIYMANKDGFLARFILTDKLRAGVIEFLAMAKSRGLEIEILSGDQSNNVAILADMLGIEKYQGNLLPEDKLQRISQLQADGANVLMLGDGINDIPVLAQADLSLAMAEASDLAKMKADGMLLGSSWYPLLALFSHSKQTRMIIRQNIAWALLYNGITLPLAAMGHVPPWLAAIGMSLSSIVVTVNAMRLRKVKDLSTNSISINATCDPNTTARVPV